MILNIGGTRYSMYYNKSTIAPGFVPLCVQHFPHIVTYIHKLL